jgi:hypothetical protein
LFDMVDQFRLKRVSHTQVNIEFNSLKLGTSRGKWRAEIDHTLQRRQING